VVDHEARFAGIVTQSDVVAALYESRLADALPSVGAVGPAAGPAVGSGVH
jgi:CBS domain-containing membrane protein